MTQPTTPPPFVPVTPGPEATPAPAPAATEVAITDAIRNSVIAEHKAERRDKLVDRGVKAAVLGAAAVFLGFNAYMINDIQDMPSGVDSKTSKDGSSLDSTFTGSLFKAEVVVQKDASGNLPKDPQKLRANLSPKGVKIAELVIGDASVVGLGLGIGRKIRKDKTAK